MYLPSPLHRSVLLLTAASALALSACIGDSPAPAGERVGGGAAMGGEPIGDTFETFEAWKAKLPRDPTDGAYLVEGDIGIRDEETLRKYYADHGQPGALIVNQREDGSDDRWGDDRKMNLTYCVSPSFGGRRGEVAAAMESATGDWAGAAAVRFVHRTAADDSCAADGDGVVFEVVPAHNTSYNGRSFFPSFAEHGTHTLYLDLENVAEAAPKTLTGVLRHEARSRARLPARARPPGGRRHVRRVARFPGPDSV
ncbi:MAG: hypothetical protein QM820_01890 [Minicystis sp.]